MTPAAPPKIAGVARALAGAVKEELAIRERLEQLRKRQARRREADQLRTLVTRQTPPD